MFAFETRNGIHVTIKLQMYKSSVLERNIFVISKTPGKNTKCTLLSRGRSYNTGSLKISNWNILNCIFHLWRKVH